MGFSLMFSVRTLYTEAQVLRGRCPHIRCSGRDLATEHLDEATPRHFNRILQVISQIRQQSYLHLLHNHCQRHNSTYAVQFVKIEILKNATNAIDEKI